MKKKLLIFIIIGAVIILAGALAVLYAFTSPWSGDFYPDFLVDHDWEGCDGEINCTEVISFHKDGGFAYYCGCGSPVDDYDLFDSYKYDESTETIKVKGFGVRMMKVLYHNSEYMFLSIGGEFRAFINENAKGAWLEPWIASEILDTAPFCTNIVKMEDEKITFLPYHYEGIADKNYNGEDYTAPLTEDCKAYSLYTFLDKNGEETRKYNEIPISDALEKDDRGFTEAYLDFNEKGEITKIIVYENTIEYEE